MGTKIPEPTIIGVDISDQNQFYNTTPLYNTLTVVRSIFNRNPLCFKPFFTPVGISLARNPRRSQDGVTVKNRDRHEQIKCYKATKYPYPQ